MGYAYVTLNLNDPEDKLLQVRSHVTTKFEVFSSLKVFLHIHIYYN